MTFLGSLSSNINDTLLQNLQRAKGISDVSFNANWSEFFSFYIVMFLKVLKYYFLCNTNGLFLFFFQDCEILNAY